MDEAELIRNQAKALLENAKAFEPTITRDIRQMVIIVGGEIVGLENRFKEENSLVRKLEERTRERVGVFSKILSRQSKKINDVLRYTIVLDRQEYVKKYEEFVRQLKANNYAVIRTFNAWLTAGTDSDLGYRGVNLTVKHFQEQIFEIQFHTPESWHLKSKNHPLYAERRLRSTPMERKKELLGQQIEDAEMILHPLEIEQIGELQ